MSKTQVPLDRTEPNPYQPRIDTGDVESLAETILEHGLRSLPEGRLLVDDYQPDTYSAFTEAEDGEWWVSEEKGRAQIASGHRRVLAVQLLNDDDTVTDGDLEDADLVPGHVPIDLQRISDEKMLELLTLENAHRQDLSPIEQARLIKTHSERGRTNAKIGESFGRSGSWVSNRKRLLDLPQEIRGHVHEGDLSVRQARALEPIFETDTDGLTWPENNRFDPERIVERALEGEPSDELRRDVRQFESWVRQLRGKTQQEVREQEYEKQLDSTDHNDGPAEDRPDRKRTRADDSPDTLDTSGSPSSRSDDRGPRSERNGTVRPDETQSRTELDEGESDEASGKAEEVDSADGEDVVQGIVLDVAGQIAAKIDQDVLTRHLIALAAPNERAIRNKVQKRILSLLRQEGTISIPRMAVSDVQEWIDELGYTGINVPEPESANGHVDTDQVDAILALPDNEWDPAVAEAATISSLLVAHRVAGERGRTWLSKSISEVVHDREGTVTEDDIPDEAMDEVQSEVEKRLEPQAA